MSFDTQTFGHGNRVIARAEKGPNEGCSTKAKRLPAATDAKKHRNQRHPRGTTRQEKC